MKVKVKGADLATMLANIGQKLQKGEITFGTAREVQERHVAENPNIFKDHEEATRQRVPARIAKDPISWTSAREAARDRGEDVASPDVVQKAYEAVVKGIPGDPEMDMLLDDQSVREHKRFHDLHDGLTFVQIMHPNFDVRRSKHWPAYKRLASKLTGKVVGSEQKLLTTGGSGTGAEFIPNTLSGTLVPLFRQKLVLASMFEHIVMPTSPYRLPLEGVDTKAYLVAEASDDNPASSSNAIPARTPQTSSVTLTAVGLKVRGVVSTEAEEDSIIPMVPYMRGKLAQATVESLEDALVNGDASGTHQDTDSRTAQDWRQAWNGLRKLTASAAKIDNLNTALTGQKILSAMQYFGKFNQQPSDVLIIVGPIGELHLIADTAFNRYDAHGGTPPLVTGQIGTIGGRPVVVSGYIRENLNQAGIYDASTTTRTHALIVHRPSFALGDRRTMNVQGMLDIQTDRFILVSTWRGTFSRIQAEVSTGSQLSRNVANIVSINKNATF